MWKEIDIELLRAINGLSGNPTTDKFFVIIAFIGGFVFWTFSAAPFIFLKKWRKLAILWIIASCTAGLLTLMFKAVFAVPRPYDTYDFVNLVGEPLNDYSFPSGHAMRVAATLAAAVPLLFKDTTLCLWRKYVSIVVKMLSATLVCLGRMYMGVHYPSDVLAGVIIGSVLGFGIWKISERIERRVPVPKHT